MSQLIEAGSRVTLHFELQLADGTIAESTHPLEMPPSLVMGDGSLTPSFEACLLGMRAGQQGSFELSADQAFGPLNPDHIRYFESSAFDASISVTVGTVVAFTQPNGAEVPGVIRSVDGDSVTVDFNHPLAGQSVRFSVDVISVDKE
jgi:FKBP-type peptidyl-prolyl cis-trans isomerase SlpA